jgi:hypothetical protein
VHLEGGTSTESSNNGSVAEINSFSQTKMPVPLLFQMKKVQASA